MLREIYISLIKRYTNDLELGDRLWTEISTSYSDKSRHYHTLSHLSSMLLELNRVQDKISDWDSVLFALYYHDIIYNSTSHRNEEKSAELVEKRLGQIKYPAEKIPACSAIILATKGHFPTGDDDTDYFTDADLSILGQTWNVYLEYTKQIRKEYAMYPSFVYNPGRKKVIRHFLEMPHIFKTGHFSHKYERNARENLTKELKTL